MDFLFGLDMLKRHRCKIDLERSALVFVLPNRQSMEAPLLHEKDLDENKGGTRGFDAAKSILHRCLLSMSRPKRKSMLWSPSPFSKSMTLMVQGKK